MEIDRSRISPMMKQYFEVKDKYEDCILFFRLGDFYEMFFDDAIKASKLLELTLTGRDCGLDERAPMCGVPYHAADVYIKKLIDLGCKVAVCEQLTDPAETKGIVVRDVIRVVTPGTLTDSSMLDDGSNNYICGICYSRDDQCCAVASADVSTGEAFLSVFEGKDLEAFLAAMESDGYTVYAGKGVFYEQNMFQVANMGEIYPEDCKKFLEVLAKNIK